MWNFASNCKMRNGSHKNPPQIPTHAVSECSDDETSSNTSRDEHLDCPICWESFNIVENVPCVLWCGHTLCKNCVLGLRWAVVKFSTLPVQLPLFVSCPWCNLLSFRLLYKGSLKFPRKNFFLLWIVESKNGNEAKPSSSSPCASDQPTQPADDCASSHCSGSSNLLGRRPVGDRMQVGYDRPGRERRQSSLRKSLTFFINLTAKFPLIIIFLLIVLYVVPASAAILVVYAIITVVFALPSFLVLCFAFPSLDWLVREIVT